MNKVKISGQHYNRLRDHLYPGDEKEAVAVLLCGRNQHSDDHSLLVQDVLLIPYDACYVREADNVQWPTELINPFLERAAAEHLGIVKVHCHPGGYEHFSEKDDHSDQHLFESVHAWLDDGLPHASCIMLPSGRIFGRFFTAEGKIEPVHQISVAGYDIFNWFYVDHTTIKDEAQERNLQAFGQKTVRMLNRLQIGVVGCSGTGSPTIEQLKRLGVGKLVLVDPDHLDWVNMNRIIGTTEQDVIQKRLKVDIMKRGIEEAGFGTEATIYPTHITTAKAVKELANCDILFGCVDGAEGRHILNLISSYYLIPFFDVGVKLLADGNGGIDGIFGTTHYVQPMLSSLLSREQYNLETLRSEAQRRVDREEYERNRYLLKVGETRPAVISINMQTSATAVNDMLARIHCYRNIRNEEIDAIRIMFTDCTMYYETYPEPCPYFTKFVGRGDVDPLLNNIELSR